jgi:hypothetical protein
MLQGRQLLLLLRRWQQLQVPPLLLLVTLALSGRSLLGLLLGRVL